MNSTLKTEIKEVLDIVNKNNPGMITYGSEAPELERISTGSLELDYITGGGVPIGRWTRMYGSTMSTKSLVAIKVMANAQKLGMRCAFIDAENQFDPHWFEKHGVNTEELLVINTSVIEEIGEVIESLLEHIDVFVIDSCSICITNTKLEDGLNARQYMGINARKWKEQFVHLNSRMDKHRNTIIYIDHVNVSFGAGGISTMEPPGGQNMKFISSLSLEFKAGKWQFNRGGTWGDERDTTKKTLSGGSEPDGLKINVRAPKSRLGKPLQTAILTFDLNEGEFDIFEEYFKAAKFFKIVEGTSWLKFSEELQPKYGDKSIRPKELREMLLEDESLRDLIRAKMFNEEYELSEAPEEVGDDNGDE